MVHSGSSGGRKWNIIVEENFAGNKVVVFSSKDFSKKEFNGCGLERPVRAFCFLVDYCLKSQKVNEDSMLGIVVTRCFSLTGLSNGLRKISSVLNEPLYRKKE